MPSFKFSVSPTGNDGNPGTLEKPFATLEAAKQAVRAVPVEERTEPIHVYLRGGTYYLDKTFVLEAEDSGSEGCPISYEAYEDEEVTVSGGVRIACSWEPYRDGIMRTPVTHECHPHGIDFSQLFVDGRRQIRARYPNYDANSPLLYGGGYTDTIASLNGSRDEVGFTFDPAKFTRKVWQRPEDGIVHISHNWGNLQYRVKDVRESEHAVILGDGGFQINFVGPSGELGMPDPGRRSDWIFANRRIYIENIFEELDAPGEWYLSREDNMLYYYPAAGIDLEKAAIEVPVLEKVIEFRGTQQKPVRHVVLAGVRIAHTASTYLGLYEAPSLGDWTIHRGGAMMFNGTENCAFRDCFFDAVGGNAIFVNDYNDHAEVSRCKITEAGDSAVAVVGSRHLTYGSNRAFPLGTLVEDCLIHDCGVYGKQIAGVFCANTMRATVRHNLMYNLPRAGVCLNDCWGGGHLIEHNEIFDTVRETRDHGPFNSWGREGYWCEAQSHQFGGLTHPHPIIMRHVPEQTIIRNNFFHGIDGYVMGDYRQAVDMDDGTSNFHVYNNLCKDMAISIREGDYRVVENNIIIDPIVPMGCHVLGDANHDIVRHNIIVTRSDIYHLNDAPPTQPWLSIDNNLFFNSQAPWGYVPQITVRQRGKSVKKLTLSEWQELGYDSGSEYGDPLFADAGSGDYRVRGDSPAIKLGFANFEMDFGIGGDLPRRWLNPDEIELIAKGRMRADG